MSDHAIKNAKAWLGEIVQRMHNLALAEKDGDDETADTIREQIQESPLSVMVRDGWRTPHEKGEPHEYEVLLTTGGPALRIYGDLDEHDEPDEWPRLQWQDWGTPWTDHELGDDERESVANFARQFYYSNA